MKYSVCFWLIITLIPVSCFSGFSSVMEMIEVSSYSEYWEFVRDQKDGTHGFCVSGNLIHINLDQDGPIPEVICPHQSKYETRVKAAFAENIPYVLFEDSNGLLLAHQESGEWEVEPIPDSQDSGVFALCINTVDNLWVVKRSYQDLSLCAQRRSNGVWDSEWITLDSDIGYDSYLNVTPDESNGFYTVYNLHFPNYDLRIGHFDGLSYISDTICATGDQGQHCDLAMDSDGNLHVAAWDRWSNQLLYAKGNISSGWEFEFPDNRWGYGVVSDIALNNTGHPIIVYSDEFNLYSHVATKNGTGDWDLELLTENIDGKNNFRIFFNTTDQPVIFGGAARLRKYTKTDSSWNADTVFVPLSRYTNSFNIFDNGDGSPSKMYLRLH